MKFTYQITLCSVMIFALLLSSCGKKQIPPPDIKEWQEYKDPFYGFELQYPKGWIVNAEGNRLKIYSSQEAATKFFDPASSGDGGVEIIFDSEKFSAAGSSDLTSYKTQTKEKISGLGEVGKEEPTTLGGETAEAISYESKLSSKVSIFGKRIITARDSVFYYLNIAGFNDYYTVYQPIFETMINSVKLPKPKPKTNDPNEIVKPSAEVTKFSNEFIEIQHPDNFEVSYPQKKSDVTFVMNIQGLRQDCNILIDMQSAKKASLDKVFDENKGKYKPTKTGTAKIDGVDAKYLNTSPAASIERKVYFAVKNDKMYRIILTWYKPMSSDFLPAFEKAVASLKLK